MHLGRWLRMTMVLLGIWQLSACSPEKPAEIKPTLHDIQAQRAREALRPQDVKLAAKYSRSCLMCHTSTDAKAPLVHDRADWQKRIAERGLDTVISHAQSGFNAMPPKGQCMDCSEAELKALTQFMMGDAL